MKIIFIFDSTYPFYTGGIETWVFNICERLIKDNDITIFTVEKFRKDNKMGCHTGINPKIKFIPVKNLNHVKALAPFIRSYIAVLNSNITVHAMRSALRKYLNESEKYYVISLGTVFAAKTARLIKKEFPNVISIVSSRSLHPEVLGETYPGVGRIALRMEKENLEAADEIWSNGLDTQKALCLKGFKSKVIKNGVNIQKIDATPPFDFSKMGLEDKIKIVTIGTVQKIKGYYEIIEAIKILKQKYGKEVHLIGVGKGNIEKFDDFSVKQGVSEQVHLIGEQKDSVKYAKGAQLIVCLSGGSGYGMAALEAMACKKPIIAWDSPVYQQMIENGKSGLLVPAWDSQALAEGICKVIANIEEYSACGEEAYKAVGKFDWNNVIQDMLTAMRSL